MQEEIKLLADFQFLNPLLKKKYFFLANPRIDLKKK